MRANPQVRTRLVIGRVTGYLVTSALLVVAHAMIPVGADAQQDSVTVHAGARYAAGSLTRALLGSDHRDLWAAPIRVPVLDPDTFAGGLTLLQRGTGLQTLSLRFRGGDGAEYVFRSVDKNQAGGLPEELRGTFTARLLQDQVSAKHPGAALVVAELLRAVGVPHPRPRLAVMMDHPVLGEHRNEFGAMLGYIEERPEEAADGRGFGGYARVIGSEQLLERLEQSSGDRADAGAYLRARLIDLLVGDWDRHPDQWRWGSETRDGVRYWVAIPRDRDNAFSSYDGLAGRIGASFRPSVQAFGPRYGSVYGLTHNGQPLDRRILPELSPTAWDGIVAEVTSRITDAVIRDAVHRMPVSYVRLGGAELESALRARRDALPRAASEFRALLMTEVDVRATDQADRAGITRFPDGAVTVRLSASNDPAPYFDRTFLPSETREVRVHLHGGTDRAELNGTGGPITVRVLGGGGDDEFVDASSSASRSRNAFYDHRGDDRLVAANGAVDRRPPPDVGGGARLDNNAPAPRDWGSERTLFRPAGAWPAGIGPVVGGGPAWTRYGFRRFPHATDTHVRAMVSPLHGRFGVELESHLVRTGSDAAVRLEARATGLHLTHFHGYGNETPRVADPALQRIWGTELSAAALLTRDLAEGLSVAAGPTLRHLRPSPRIVETAALPGGAPYSFAALLATATIERGGEGPHARRLRLQLRGEGAPLVEGKGIEPFARGEAAASAAIPLGGWLEPVIALRGSAAAVTRSAPLQFAAFLGGASTLRGHDTQRFAGTAATAGSVELRTTLTRANLLFARGDVGTIAFADVGRVFAPGENSSRIHSGYGGGLWFGTLEGALTAHVLLGFGERRTLHAGFGFPF